MLILFPFLALPAPDATGAGAAKAQGVHMNIIYAATRNLYEPLSVTIKSLLDHNSPDMIYILAEDDELPFEIDAPHKVINVSGQLIFPETSANYNSQFTYMALMRIMYVYLLPEVDKVLQLDVDTIVCDNLRPLYDMDITDRWAACVPEYFSNYKPFHMQYYNIGVCLYNLAQMRKENVVPLMVQDLNINRYMCLEQDILNKYGAPLNKLVPVPSRYNECFCCGYSDNPAVIHYAGFPDWWTNKDIPKREYLDRYINEAT